MLASSWWASSQEMRKSDRDHLWQVGLETGDSGERPRWNPERPWPEIGKPPKPIDRRSTASATPRREPARKHWHKEIIG